MTGQRQKAGLCGWTKEVLNVAGKRRAVRGATDGDDRIITEAAILQTSLLQCEARQ